MCVLETQAEATALPRAASLVSHNGLIFILPERFQFATNSTNRATVIVIVIARQLNRKRAHQL